MCNDIATIYCESWKGTSPFFFFNFYIIKMKILAFPSKKLK